MSESHSEVDHAAIRERYRVERDKRIRTDGPTQYVEPTGRFAWMLDDPYVKPVPRDPIREELTVAIIGGGFGGLCTGARLKEAGVTDVRILEGGGDFGGAWYWNRYPGAMCDTAAMIYLPLLEETGHMPTKKYVFAPEIFGHAQRIGKTYGLYERALFSTHVTSLEWEASTSRWLIRTNRGDELRAKFVAMGTGPLHRPKLPGIPGIESFKGHCFHTSRWDYSVTGGDAGGAPMTRLASLRVGIIGTGATSVQVVPCLARDAKEVYVFQRTPSSIDVRNNHPIDPEWFRSLPAGWQRSWLVNFATLQTGGYADQDLVKDGWTDISQRLRNRIFTAAMEAASRGAEYGPAEIQKAFRDCDDDKMEEVRARVDAVVNDPATAQKLKAWYSQLCKRPCFHDEYLQAFNVPSCHLVDTDGKGVEQIDETGVWVQGQHYPVDVLVFASGFEVGTPHARRSGFDTVGRDGRPLSVHWADGMQTLHGMQMHGFPNLFVIGLTQGGNLISNITHNLEEAGRTIATVVAAAIARGAREVEVTREAEQAWITSLEGGMATFLANPECTPGYYNNEGAPLGRKELLNVAGYPGGPVAYFEYLENWRSSGEFRGLEFRS
ncbi:MAG: NAD(P)/FAD-dependent oxidoreductase [Deltaproteobacteria bacterium]|nr:NAD(P)/FAD-dependent oxidoreductase [Deltaproteobacteria bacterium]